jgi:hypothetical protein
MSSSKPSTPILQRRYGGGGENEFSGVSRIPVSLSPVPFRRTNSMRLRPNCSLYNNNNNNATNSTLSETTLKQHNKNLQQSKNNSAAVCSDKVRQLRLINLQRARRGSLCMDVDEPKCNGVGEGDPGGTSKNHHGNGKPMMNGDLTRKNDRGMVSESLAIGQQLDVHFSRLCNFMRKKKKFVSIFFLPS